MGYQDILLAMVSYPDPTPRQALDAAAGLAGRLGGEVTGLALWADIPQVGNLLANTLIHLDEMAREQEAESAAQARESAAAFSAAAQARGLACHTLLAAAPLYGEGDCVAAHARTRDICLLAVGQTVQADTAIAETVLFGSGRPVVVFPEDLAPPTGEAFATAAIGWDGSRTAARAVADAMPALKAAGQVRILVVTDEKPLAGTAGAPDLVRHLSSHGVQAVIDDLPSGGEPIGRVFRDYVAARGVDLLVMGGFGHSRLSDFILGGATGAMLDAPPCPVLMSH